MFYSPVTKGFLDPKIHGDIPAYCIEVSDEQYAMLLHAQSEGMQIVPGVGDAPVAIPVTIPPAEIKFVAKLRIDAGAERARLRYITPGAGQALVYQRKEYQARACLAAHDALNPPAAGAYPALDAEIGITGVDTLAVAQTVVTLADQWGAIADAIEAQRLSAKAEIDSVPDNAADIEAQIAAIEAGIVWPAP